MGLRRIRKLKYHLKYSIIFFLLLFFLLPLLIQNLVNKSVFENILESKIYKLSDQTAESLSYSVSNALQAQFDIVKSAANNPEVLNYVSGEQGGTTQQRYAGIYYEIVKNSDATKNAYPFHYIIENQKGELFTSAFALKEGRLDARGEGFSSDETVKGLWHSYTFTSKFYIHDNYILSKAGTQLYCGANLLKADQQLGIIAVGMDASYFAKLLSRSLFGENGSVFLIDEKGVCLIQGDGSKLGYEELSTKLREKMLLNIGKEGYQTFSYHNQTYILFMHSVKVKGCNTGWQMVNISPQEDLTSDLRYINLVNYIMILLCVICITILLVFFRVKIFRPLRVLNQMTKEIGKGNLDIQMPVQTSGDKNEIEGLMEAFSEMAGDLKNSISRIKEQEQNKHQMEMKMLQAQIKPHFVRNTLNSIRWMAKLKGAEGISRSILAFSNMLDYNFSDSRIFVTVKEELKYVEEYLYLQQIRFQNKFSYEIDVEQDMMDGMILKLLFQPVVENSINHGVLPKRGVGLIVIRGRRSNENYVFEIIDDGVGMEQAQVDTLLDKKENWEKAHEEENIALWNINQRMQMHYGGSAVIEIRSKPGIGSAVTMVFPAASQGCEEFPAVSKGDEEHEHVKSNDCG